MVSDNPLIGRQTPVTGKYVPNPLGRLVEVNLPLVSVLQVEI